jgi:gamma-glutamyl hercynylcysteine S-oxide synthase
MSQPLTTPETVAELLADARERTLLLIAPLSESELRAQHNRLMSPLLWDLGHIAHFEELWLIRNLEGPVEWNGGSLSLTGEMPGQYNPFENPRAARGELRYPSLPEVLDGMAEVRRRVLGHLERLDMSNGDALLRGGYVFRMVAQHEYQHNETMLQALQLKDDPPYAAPLAVRFPDPHPLPPAEGEQDGMVRFAGGEVAIGTDDRTCAYDNERPRHTRRLEPFWIDRTPVTNGAYREFMDDGGYERRELWSDAGWAWKEETGAAAPQYWSRDRDGWTTRRMNRGLPLDPREPVCHVCCHEAEAYARWAGKRLPTEFEWEAAASWNPGTGEKHLFPWGDRTPTPLHANLDQLAFGPAPVGTFARNLSPIGCYGMIGDVWEWTSSDFAGYPGYQSFPYKEYSEVFFGTEYRVLRGGSWATRPGAIRTTFRNWDYPIRRQIFSGFRCARDD